MKTKLLFLLISISSIHFSYSQGINFERGLNDSYNQSVLDVGVIGNSTYAVILLLSEGVMIEKLDTQGNKIWIAPLMQFSNANDVYLNEMIITNDGNLWLAGSGIVGCDLPQFKYFVVCLDSNGNQINTWDVPVTYSNDPYCYGLSTTGNSTVALNFRDGNISEIHEFSPTQKTILPNPLGKKFNGFTRVDSLNFYGFTDSILYRINQVGMMTDSMVFQSPINQITQFGGNIYALLGNEVLKATIDFSSFSLTTVTTTEALSHLKVDASNIRFLDNFPNQKKIITIDQTLSTSTFSTQNCTEQNSRLFDYDQRFALMQNYNLTFFKSIRYRNYYIGDSTENLVNNSDITVLDIQITDTYAHPQMVGNVYELNAKAKVLIKNIGQNIVDSVRLNHFIGANYVCGNDVTAKNFSNLNLVPGDSIWLDFGWLGSYTNTVFTDSISREYCVYSSNPNGIVDLNVTNDNSCKKVFFGFLGNDEFTMSDFRIYPNPTNSEIHVKYSYIEDYAYIISNSLGQISRQGKLDKSVIDLIDLDSGIYFLSIFDDKNQILVTQKIVKQ